MLEHVDSELVALNKVCASCSCSGDDVILLLHQTVDNFSAFEQVYDSYVSHARRELRSLFLSEADIETRSYFDSKPLDQGVNMCIAAASVQARCVSSWRTTKV